MLRTAGLDYAAGFPLARLAKIMASQLPSISVSGFPVAAQPIVVPRRDYADLLTATAAFLRLQHAAVKNMAADHTGRLAELKADRVDFPRFVADDHFEMLHASDMARADVILGPTGPQFIEFNVGGGFAGMVQFEVLRRIWREVGDACGQPPLTAGSPFDSLAALISRTCAETGRRPEVLFLNSFDDSGRTPAELETQLGFLRERGVPARFADVRTVSVEDVLAASARPVVIVQFSEREALDAGWDISSLLHMLAAGMTAIPSQSARLIDSKKVMALLSEGLPWMGKGDYALVRRYVPWTRIVRDRTVHWGDRAWHIQQLLIEEQPKFVLKGSAGLSGKEVTFGAHCTADRWAQLVSSALDTEYYVAQEVVESVRVPIRVLHDDVGRHDCSTVKMVVSPFCIGGIPTGCHVRMDPTAGLGLVTRGTGAFPGCLLGAP